MRPGLLAALLALALTATGCGSSELHTGEELRSVLSKDSVLLPVPAVTDDTKGACGLACLTSLLRYHGLDLDAEARSRFPDEAAKRGSIAAGDIRDYLRGRGLRAHLVHGTLDAVPPRGLFGILAGKLPVIVALKLESSDHYALVCGFDRERRWVIIMDPSRGICGVPFESFDGYWSGAERLMLVAAPAPRRDPPPH